MRLPILLVLFLSTILGLDAQIFTPVKWSDDTKALENDEFELIFTASIDDNWWIYSQFLEGDGPIPTSITFDEGSHFEVIGKAVESGTMKEGPEPLFDNMILKKFMAPTASFTQKVKIKDYNKAITGYLTFMTCDKSKCLPPKDYDFEFNLTATKKNAAENTSTTASAEQKTNPSKTSTSNTGNQKKAKEQNVTITSNQTSSSLSANGSKSTAKAGKQSQNQENDPPPASKKSNILKPVTWTMDVKPDADNLIINFNADIQKGWTIYSQHTSEEGPVPTSFNFDAGDHYSGGGMAEENGKKKEGPDPYFDNVNVIKFLAPKATFTKKINVKDPTKPISGYLEFMTCDNSRCLPPASVDFWIEANKQIYLLGDEATIKVEAALNAQDSDSANPSSASAAASGQNLYPIPAPNLDKPVAKCENVTVAEVNESKSIWSIFILGFLGGLVALLTPCVFPMIPLTVSFFTKGSEDKKKGISNAIMYGFFIFLVYLVLSIPFHLMDSINPDILNDISTNVYLNIAFFLIFLFFAFSFFGYYELTLPSSLTNKVSSAEGVGGVLGIFFMALTLALVSFSCTGPILGSLLAGALSSDGGAMQLTSGMGGFGLALALPFALFAAFPGWMNTLPKSGGWLNTVKVVLGFLELALAFKFLSNADLVKRWGLLKIEPFLMIWIVIFILLGVYLFGKIKFPHDSPIKKLSFLRISTGILSIAFAIYLMSGFRFDERAQTFKSLTLLSGLAPPTGYSWVYPKKCPNNLDCFKDFDSGYAYAQEVNKPIMIDFTGHACVNCRKMEEHVWPKKEIYNYLKDEFVLISLYVDEKIPLPEAEQIFVEQKTGGKRKLRNHGHKWAHFQTEYFNNNSQPYYVLLTPDGKLLNTPVGYTPDAQKYASFLQCGLDAFKDKKLLGSK